VLRLLVIPAPAPAPAPPERRCNPCNVFKPTSLVFGFVVKGRDILLLVELKLLILALFDIDDIVVVVVCMIEDRICGGLAFGNVEFAFTIDGVEVEVEVDASDDDVFGFFDASSSSLGSSAGSLEKQW
jgi:hypothetical protein